MAKADAIGHRRALERDGPGQRQARAGHGQRLQFPGGDHFGQQHGRGLQRFDLLFGIAAARPILHHQHAQDIAAAQNRHAEERVINFLAGFRLVRKCRMGLRIRQCQRFGAGGDQADQALAGFHGRRMHSLAVEAFGGIEFEIGIGAHDIDRADFRHHVGSDQHGDAVQARLRADRLRHGFAETAQKLSWSGQWAPHGLLSSPGQWPVAPGSKSRPASTSGIANAKTGPQARCLARCPAHCPARAQRRRPRHFRRAAGPPGSRWHQRLAGCSDFSKTSRNDLAASGPRWLASL